MTKHPFISLLLLSVPLAACSTWKPPAITYDDTPRPATLQPELPKPVDVVEVPKLLPLPDQLKPLPDLAPPHHDTENPRVTVAQANKEARIQPSQDGYINAIQVYPFSDGALYQVYAAPGEVTDVALQAGEQLVGSGPVAAGDTVRWVIGNTESGTGATKRIHILLKPTQKGLTTNLVINTDRRTYHLELRAVDKTYMASVSFNYPQDELIALKAQNTVAEQVTPIVTDIDLSQLSFRYNIEGDNPPWRPLRAMDNGKQVFIQFPAGIGQGEMPPLIVIGGQGNDEIPRYRISGNYMIVDGLFAAAELRLGADPQATVRIVRNDGKKPS
jgi:type IV secretion system protein VirB9